jgi:hypothetical protein
MADDKIVHRVSLEGAEDVANKLKKIGDAGSDAFKKVKQYADDSHSSLGKAGDAFGGNTDGGRLAAERFREVLHALHPVLDSAGLGLGNLGAFSRVAGAGMAALAATIAASILVGLAKLGDEADKAKRRLDSLSGAGKGGGESQFGTLKKDLKELHADLADVAPLAETFFKSQQDSRASNRSVIHPPGWSAGEAEEAANRVQTFNGSQVTPAGGLSSSTYETAIKSILEAGRISRATNKESSEAYNEFYGSTKGGKGQITADAYDKLTLAVPALADAVAKAASGSGVGGTGQEFEGRAGFRAYLERGGKYTGDQSVAGLARAEPEIRAESAKVPVDFTEAVDRAGTAAKGFAEKLGDATMRASKFLNETPAEVLGADIKRPEQAFPNLPGPSPLSFSAPRHERTAEDSDVQDIASPITKGPLPAPELKAQAPASNEPEPPLYRPLHGPDPYAPATIGPRSEAGRPSVVAAGMPDPVAALNKVADIATKLIIAAASSLATLPKRAIEGSTADVQNLGDHSQPLQSVGPASTEAPVVPIPSSKPSEFQYIPPPKNEFQYIPPPSPDEQRQPSSPPPQQPSNTPIQFGDDAATGKVADLGAAAEDAAAKLRGIEAPAAPVATTAAIPEQPVSRADGGAIRMADGGQARLNVSPGGHLNGPGTGKSDSIPADVANGEFVVNAEDTSKNLELLHDVNSGKLSGGHYAAGGEVRHFADGGDVIGTGGTDLYANPADDAPYTPQWEGDGTYFDPVTQTWKRKKKKHKSDFVGKFGGHVFDTPGTYAEGGLVGNRPSSFAARLSAQHFAKGGLAASTFADRISAMGLSTIDVPHLALGGMPDISPPTLSGDSSVFKSPEGGHGQLHPVTLNLPAGGSVDGVYAKPDAVAQLRAAANQAKRFSTGSKPPWYGGVAR